MSHRAGPDDKQVKDEDTDKDNRNDVNRNTDQRNDVNRNTDHHDERVDHGPNPNERGKWISAVIALLGVWMVLQVLGGEFTSGEVMNGLFAGEPSAAQYWNDILVGALLIGVGGYNYSQRANERFGNTAVAMIAVVAGLWLIAAPFVVGPDAGATETVSELAFYNDIIVGLLAAGLGAYSAYTARDHQHDTPRTTT